MSESTIGLQIRDNLLFLTKKFNISEAELSRQANVPQATVNRLLKGSTDDPRASTLKAIAAFFSITVDQLLNEKLLKESTSETTYLPVYNMDQSPSIFEKLKNESCFDLINLFTKKENKAIEVEPSINPQCMAFEVRGDSMWPQFIEGTFVILDTKIEAKHRSFVIYFLADLQQLVLRQYIEEEQNRILKPLNYGYKPIQIQEKDIFIGTVIQAKSDFRKS
ncbi:peptidase, S24 family [Legionella busanensis]|uniref:Peptidase, S24 family n=1 Tax=Legionella busanensis TaxID=190655 RepID=A0A378KA21_9GAMM|nr:LexA family transcriptional regulator [Legionella busanensis]STX81556.1 peptidase, S24 family [Legionella busanensis]